MAPSKYRFVCFVHDDPFEWEHLPISPLPSLSSQYVATMWADYDARGVFVFGVNPHLRMLQWPPTASFTPQNKKLTQPVSCSFSNPLPFGFASHLLSERVVFFVTSFRSADGKVAKTWRGGKKLGCLTLLYQQHLPFPLLPLLLLCIHVSQRLSLFWRLSWACLWV